MSHTMKFRKKPVIIEAFQFDGDLMNSKGHYYVPDWAVKRGRKGLCTIRGLNYTSRPWKEITM